MMKNRRITSRDGFTLYVCASGPQDLFLTVSVSRPVSDWTTLTDAIYRDIQAALQTSGLQIVHERLFGSLACRPAILAGREQVMRDLDRTQRHPLTFIQGHPFWGIGLAGIQIQAVTVPSVETVYDDGQPCGRKWSRNGVTFLILNILDGLSTPALTGIARCQAEAKQMFERADRLLHANQATYTDVARTWIYLSDILDWYAEFNEVRNAKYGDWGLMPDTQSPTRSETIRLPASTGIRGDNPAGAACVMDLLAISGPAHLRPKIIQMTNHRQQDAFQYGRAFSRGACIQEADQTSVHISGTAAIDERGQSLFPDDMVSQTRRTLDNIEALLEPVGVNFGQIASATVFVKRREDTEAYAQIISERGYLDLPAVCVIADVCRPELLFEMDAVLALPLHL